MRKVTEKGWLAARGEREERDTGGGMAILRPREATVYSCRRILLYSPEEIRLSSGNGCVSVVGEDLHCASFSGDTVLIRGRIRAICYPLGSPSEKGGN